MPIKYPKNANPNITGGIETDLMYKNVMEDWAWGGMDDLEHGIYMDENNRRMVTNVRLQMSNLSDALIDKNDPSNVAFIETNARLQVEHTVTEAVTGVDLVQSQIRIIGGESLSDLGLTQAQIPEPRGHAIQCRVNTETMTIEGSARPTGGTLTTFDPPSGPGVRVDTYGYTGYSTSPNYDSLLAKVIGYSSTSSYADAVRRTRRALEEFHIKGVETNISYLMALLDRIEAVSYTHLTLPTNREV